MFQPLKFSEGMVKVKTESNNDQNVQIDTVAVSVSQKNTTTTSLEDRNKNLVSELVSLKTANSKIFFEFEKAKESMNLLESENRLLKESVKKFQCTEEHVAKLNTELRDVTNQLNISKKENTHLQARCLELQMGIDQSKTETQSNQLEENGYYEVEKILDHKIKRNGTCYLVSWTGYDPSHNCWVTEKNLCCPNILNNYKSSKNLK